LFFATALAVLKPNESGMGAARSDQVGSGFEQVMWIGRPTMNRKMTLFVWRAMRGVR